MVAVGPDALGELHDSRTALYRLVRPFVRRIGEKGPVHEYAASAAVQRRSKDPRYEPPGLVAYLGGQH